jgi:hypothetical protein
MRQAVNNSGVKVVWTRPIFEIGTFLFVKCHLIASKQLLSQVRCKETKPFGNTAIEKGCYKDFD